MLPYMAYMDPMGYIRRIVSSDQFMISHNADNYGHNLQIYIANIASSTLNIPE